MKHVREEELMKEVSLDPIAVDLSELVITETTGDDRTKVHACLNWLLNAGLKPHQAIRASTLARYRLGTKF
jgi:hypothetical protein